MNKLLKILGAAAGAAVVAACVPYHFENDKETGRMEVDALLWNLTKTPGKDEDTYTMKLLPFINTEEEEAAEVIDVEEVSEDAAEETTEEAAEEEAVEEPFTEEAEPEVVVETVDTAKEAVEEPFAQAEEPEVEVEEAE